MLLFACGIPNPVGFLPVLVVVGEMITAMQPSLKIHPAQKMKKH